MTSDSLKFNYVCDSWLQFVDYSLWNKSIVMLKCIVEISFTLNYDVSSFVAFGILSGCVYRC